LLGLDTMSMITGRYPSGRKRWRFCLDCLYAN
jgi:hypothetical protein